MDHRQQSDSERSLLQPTNNHAHGDPSSTESPRLPFLKETFLMRIRRYLNWTETNIQIRLAAPMVAINVFTYCLPFITIMFIGHLGELQLSSASLATSVANVTGVSVLMGMAFSLETLCGQAYGAKEYKKMGIYMQRAIVVLVAVAILLSFVWAYMEKILLALGQDSQISSGAGDYTRWQIPSLFAYATSQPLLKFLQTQSRVTPLICMGFATFCCHLPICWLLIYKSGLGFEGGAIANAISYWINTLLLAAYVQFSPTCSDTRAPLSREALHDLIGFCKLAVPSAGMLCLEWWAFEIMVILSGLLADPELQTSALSICINTCSLAFMVPFGIGAAASTRVSNELGAAHPQAARAAMRVAMCIAVSAAVTMSIVILLIRKIWARAYSDEEDVISYVSFLLQFVALSALLDNLQGVLSGVIRGVGWQKAGAIVNLAAYYGVGLPVGVLLAFVADLSGKGLLIGLISGGSTQVVCLSIILWMANWDEEAKQIGARMKSERLPFATEPLLSQEGDPT